MMLQSVQPEPWWHHIAEIFITSTVPIALYMWKNRMSARKDIEAKHEQNQAVLQELKNEHDERPAHLHTEKSGPLCAENIRYGPRQ